MAKRQNKKGGVPRRHYNAAKKHRHQRCWARSEARKQRNRIRNGG